MENLKMFNIKDKNIIVTGASSGLGQHIAEFFASHGANIIICARRAERLEQLQQKIAQLQNELAEVQKQMDEYLKLF